MTKNHKLKKFKFDEPQLQHFFEVLGKESNEKIQLFYLLSLTTGLRVNEILNLTYGDVDEKNSILSCLTVKQRKVDIVINASLLEIIKKESELNPSDSYIFQSKKSNNVVNKPIKQLSRQAVNYAFKKAKDSTGISITPNKLRHMYATEFFKKISMQGSHVLHEEMLKKFK